jgi:uncharacterized HAD superfamily protein
MSGQMLRIGIDIDDVLLHSADQTIKLYNDTYGTSMTTNNWYDFSSMELWGTDDKSEVVKRVSLLFAEDDFADVKPIMNANEVLTHLERAGHELFAITGRPESIRKQTMEVLGKYYPGLFIDSSVYFVDHFSHDGNKANKADLALELGLTHFIDDQVEHVNLLDRAGVKTVLFSQDYAWNQSGADKNIIRLGDWQSVGKFLDAEAAL